MNVQMDTKCITCGEEHGQLMTYCGAFLQPHQVVEMACDVPDEMNEALTESEDEAEQDEIPPPPPL